MLNVHDKLADGSPITEPCNRLSGIFQGESFGNARLDLALGDDVEPVSLVALVEEDVAALVAGAAHRREERLGGPVAEGRPANLCVIDPDLEWTVDPADTASRSRNNPYAGRTLKGRVRHTVYRGEPVVIDTESQR